MDHKQIAVELFNKTWDLLDKTSRTAEETAQMIHQAHASLYHWYQVGTPLNFQRGEWMLSHVYAVLNMQESALYHAERCMAITTQNGIDDFDLTFAYEAFARAYLITKGHLTEDYLTLAYESLNQVKTGDDRGYAKSQLDEIKSRL